MLKIYASTKVKTIDLKDLKENIFNICNYLFIKFFDMEYCIFKNDNKDKLKYLYELREGYKKKYYLTFNDLLIDLNNINNGLKIKFDEIKGS